MVMFQILRDFHDNNIQLLYYILTAEIIMCKFSELKLVRRCGQ